MVWHQPTWMNILSLSNGEKVWGGGGLSCIERGQQVWLYEKVAQAMIPVCSIKIFKVLKKHVF